MKSKKEIPVKYNHFDNDFLEEILPNPDRGKPNEELNKLLPEIRLLGLSESYIDYIKELNDYDFAAYILRKLQGDVPPTKEELRSINLYYNKTDLLLKKDIEKVLRCNEIFVVSTGDSSKVLTFTVDNWENLSIEEQHSRLKKALAALEGRI